MSDKNRLNSFKRELRLVLRDRGLTVAIGSVLSGIIIGALLQNTSRAGISENILSFLIEFSTDFTDKSKGEIFAGIALSGITYFIIMFLMGSSFLGKYFIPVISTVKISGIGAILSFLYDRFGMKGLAYTLLVFFPGKLLLIFAVVYMTKISFDTAAGIIKPQTRQGSTLENIKEYAVRSLLVLIVFLLSWLVDFLCILIFSGLFDFS